MGGLYVRTTVLYVRTAKGVFFDGCTYFSLTNSVLYVLCTQMGDLLFCTYFHSLYVLYVVFCCFLRTNCVFYVPTNLKCFYKGEIVRNVLLVFLEVGV